LNGGQLGAQSDYGAALTTASWYGMESIVSLLLKLGADIDARSGPDGWALHTAMAMKREKIAQLLIENGANVNLQVSYTVKV
jgi:ankyrin repeat protein